MAFSAPHGRFGHGRLAVNVLATKQRKGNPAMKRLNVLVRYLMPLVLVASISGCASTPTHESTGQYVDNTVITTEVKAALAKDDLLKSFQISVTSYKDTVQLSGFVNSQAAKDKAGELAKDAKGVKKVKNDLIVK
jgi:uncharacterized lipoprotein YehR (DUF1307 family)